MLTFYMSGHSQGVYKNTKNQMILTITVNNANWNFIMKYAF